MEVGSASGSSTLYGYQASVAAGTLSAAVAQLQAPQTSATSSGAATAGIQGLAPSQVLGGLDSSAAASLLQSQSSASSSANGLQGLDSAAASGAAPSWAATQARQAYGNGTLTINAQDQARNEQNPATQNETTSTGGDLVLAQAAAGAIPAYTQQASAAAQLGAINNTFSLLA